ncbi:MAG TPA: phosphoribosylanthranilate isomerase [Gemmatimonadaceae bacterium]|nr:phosphoribosylanthranilate isomerase [Gemmatimonadaceae bacterium]
MAEIKFCGLTRAVDAEHAVALGAAYVGAIFAGGPRLLTIPRAAEVFAHVPDTVGRVGVFADQTPTEIARTAEAVGLSVVQLQVGGDEARVEQIRHFFDGDVWLVHRVKDADLPQAASELVTYGDGIVLDTFVPTVLGGSGQAMDWDRLAPRLDTIRHSKRLILAGGLRPENVARAIAAISPDVVDVSSGVEAAPGIKDHERMTAFRDAVLEASIST